MATENDPKAPSTEGGDSTEIEAAKAEAAPSDASGEGEAAAAAKTEDGDAAKASEEAAKPSDDAKPAEDAAAAAASADESGEDAKADESDAKPDESDAKPDESDAKPDSPAKGADGAAKPEPDPMPIKGARWAQPIAVFERRWTWAESRLLTFVLIWQLVSLVSWVLLSGISAPPSTGDASGAAFRSVTAALILGIGGWVGARKMPLEKRRLITIAGLVVGICVGLVLRPSSDATGGLRLAINRGLRLDRLDAFLVDYFGNIKGWLQEGSTLTLMGGLRGLATRLTLWLALLGASMATAAGKHIHIDVIFRFLPKKLRIPAAIINFCAAATVCFAGAWGFIDHLAIESFDAKAEAPAGEKVSVIAHHMGQHAFLTRKQIGLDLRSLPHVLMGERYDQWMSAAAWNEWVKSGGFDDKYKAEEISTILVPEDSAPHPPLVMAPDGDATRGILIHDLNFVFPFGLAVIGLRFLLRAILTLSGHIPVDPDAAHKEELPGAHGDAAKAGGA